MGRGAENDFFNQLENSDLTCMYLTTSVESIQKHILNLNDGRGHDLIHSKFLKNAGTDYLEILVKLLNACFSHGFFPRNLLHGVITPVLKNSSANSTDSDSYRPIMQSSCILKLAEMCILYVLDSRIPLNTRQCGYTKNVSAADPTLLLKETVYKYCVEKKFVAFALFVDLSKAFDRVNHLKLGNILLKKRVPPDVIWIILSYLGSQTARVKWGKVLGDVGPMGRGVRQGGILSAAIFKIYIDDILNEISAMDEGCMLNYFKINILAYADDMVLLAPTLGALDRLYRRFSHLLVDLDMLINRNKSKVIVFSRTSAYRNYLPNVLLGGEEFEVVTSYKYLGHFITHNLNDDVDTEFRLKTFRIRFLTLQRKFLNFFIRYFFIFV